MAITRPFQIYPNQASVDRSQKAQRVTIPAPTGGWNTRDAPTALPPNDASVLINMVPKIGFVEMRGGYVSHSTGIGSGNVDFVKEYFDGSTRVLLTASSSNIYNSTSSGAASSLASGFSSGRWDAAQMAGVMGLVNGADAPQTFNGSTVGAMTVSGSGLTVANLVGIHVFKSRSYFWEANSQDFWYSAVNALGGTLTKFQLSQIASKGSKLLRMETWTVDGGSGPDDYAIFVMSSGECIVYQGDNPGSALAWALVGKYDIGQVVNDRAVLRYGKEIAVIVQNDIVTLPSAFGTPVPQPSKLTGAISDAVTNFDTNDGWQIFWYPRESLLMVNVPTASTSFEQYVLNMQNMSPARFTGIPSRVWGLYDGDAYFGSTDGVLYKFNTTNSDAGSDIDITSTQSWSEGGVSVNKMISALRPTIACVDSISFDIRAGYNFKEPTVSSPSSSVTTGTPWGSAWGSAWGSTTGETIVESWKMASGRGSPMTVKMRFSRQGDRPKWYKTDALIKAEGSL